MRHKGFIPWDDDIDVAMLREDYERFLTLANEFESPYFLQTNRTDQKYGFSFAKIRNSNTSGFSLKFMYQGMNDGLFIDVFPLDNYCIEAENENIFGKIKKLNFDNSTIMRRDNPHLSASDKFRLQNIEDTTDEAMKSNIEMIDTLAKKYNQVCSEFVCCYVCSFTTDKLFVMKKKWFEETATELFHGEHMPIPRGFDEFLTLLYGNYLEYPPKAGRGGAHEGAFFDADLPYVEAIKRIKNDYM